MFKLWFHTSAYPGSWLCVKWVKFEVFVKKRSGKTYSRKRMESLSLAAYHHDETVKFISLVKNFN